MPGSGIIVELPEIAKNVEVSLMEKKDQGNSVLALSLRGRVESSKTDGMPIKTVKYNSGRKKFHRHLCKLSHHYSKCDRGKGTWRIERSSCRR